MLTIDKLITELTNIKTTIPGCDGSTKVYLVGLPEVTEPRPIKCSGTAEFTDDEVFVILSDLSKDELLTAAEAEACQEERDGVWAI